MTQRSELTRLADNLASLHQQLAPGGALSDQLSRTLDTRLAAFEQRLSRQLEDQLSATLSHLLSTLLPEPLRGAADTLGPALAGSALGALLPAFADGGIIDGPAVIGLAGEAGPEAVLPLQRGPDGRLGVSVADQGDAVRAAAAPTVIILQAPPALSALMDETSDTEPPEPDLISDLFAGLSSDLTADRLDQLSSALQQAVGAALDHHLITHLDDYDGPGLGGQGGI